MASAATVVEPVAERHWTFKTPMTDRMQIADGSAIGFARHGMIQPRAAGEPPPLFDMGCVGRIIDVEALEDGRYNLVLEGFARFRVLRELLDSTQCQFCGVGDRDQVIYGAHGADAVFMGDAITAHTGRPVVRLPLTPSHRFGRKLAIKAGRLADKPYGSLAAHDTAVQLLGYDDEAECVDLIAHQVQQWRTATRGKMAGLAVLLRHPGQSIAIENRLLADGVPYTVSGFESYLLRPEVLLVRGLLAVATDNFDSVTEPRTREKLMRALVFFCGALVTAVMDDRLRRQAKR